MSRMRQIPVMDITQREKMIQQSQPAGMEYVAHPPMQNAGRPVQMNCRPRVRKAPVSRFRLSDTPALIAGGCSSVREFCNNVQNITMDLNHLIGSVERIVPLLNTYLSMMQNRSISAEQELEPPIEMGSDDFRMQCCNEKPLKQNCETYAANTVPIEPAAAKTAPMPRPEDIQALLENPLVRNLLNGFMQNGAFPNAGTAKENTPQL